MYKMKDATPPGVCPCCLSPISIFDIGLGSDFVVECYIDDNGKRGQVCQICYEAKYKNRFGNIDESPDEYVR